MVKKMVKSCLRCSATVGMGEGFSVPSKDFRMLPEGYSEKTVLLCDLCYKILIALRPEEALMSPDEAIKLIYEHNRAVTESTKAFGNSKTKNAKADAAAARLFKALIGRAPGDLERESMNYS